MCPAPNLRLEFSVATRCATVFMPPRSPKSSLIVFRLIVLTTLVAPLTAQEIVKRELRIPAPGAGKCGLEAIMVRPKEPGPHPLALISHGAPRNGNDRRRMRPEDWVPQAREFARRGWTAVIVMRRGYGDSGGDFAEGADACGRHPEYYRSGVESANDLRAAIKFLSGQPEVDPTHIISVGRSAGGFATVALTVDPPPGLVAGISFAGGRGSQATDDVCNEGDLINAFRAFGKDSRVPMLWIYAQNDHFFPPRLSAKFFQAFTEAGGVAELASAKPFGADGHKLFSQEGISIWAPMVDAFLQKQNLVWQRP